MHNNCKSWQTVMKGSKIAQLMLHKNYAYNCELQELVDADEVDEEDDDNEPTSKKEKLAIAIKRVEDDHDGFGSTGTGD